MPSSEPASDSKVCPLCSGTFDSDLRFCPRDGTPLAASRHTDDLVGRVVDGRFFVTKLLGEGGMGSVYLAEQVRMQRLCALKVIKDRSKLDAQAIVRFNREAKNASRISHTNVATVYEFGEFEDGLVYMAMEYVEGESLSALLARENALLPRRAASIAGQIADALAAAHECDIVHRDLKPENVMLAKRRGGTDLVKVVDFGIARLLGAESQVVTATGLSSGTPRYMSPEQLMSDEVDARSDIYALGLISFVMLVGRQPWDGDLVTSQPVVRIGGRARPLREHRPGVTWPDQLQAVLDKALALDPAERYQEAGTFGEELVTAIVHWIPDDAAANVPWNVSLRFDSTPRGVPRYSPGESHPAVPPPSSRGGEHAISPVAGHQSNATESAQPPGAAPLGRPGRRETKGLGRSRRVLAAVAVTAVGVIIALLATWQPGMRVTDSSVPFGAVSDSDGVPNDALAASPTRTAGRGSEQSGLVQSVDTRRAVEQKADSASVVLGNEGTPDLPQPSPPLLAPDDGRVMLARLKRLADATVSNADSAQTALALARQTLPRLTMLSDSVEAQYYMAEAHLILDQPREACLRLTAIEVTSRPGPFRAAVATLLADKELRCR